MNRWTGASLSFTAAAPGDKAAPMTLGVAQADGRANGHTQHQARRA